MGSAKPFGDLSTRLKKTWEEAKIRRGKEQSSSRIPSPLVRNPLS